MSGLINKTPPSVNTMSDPVLQEAEDRLEAGLTDSNRAPYQQIVVAGMAAALTNGPHGLMAKLATSPDPVRDAARGAVNLALLLRRQSKGVMPLKAMIPAAWTLMFRALDFVNRVGKVQVGAAELDRAAHIFTNELFGKFGITPAMLQTAAQKVNSVTQDPNSMAAINMKVGVTQHPNAANPTPIPGGPVPPGEQS